MRHLPESLAELARELPATMSKADAAMVLTVSTRTIDRAIARGELRVSKTTNGRAGRVIITRAEVLRWMAEHMQ